MKRLFLMFALLLPSLGWAQSGCPSGYSYWVKLNVIKVPNGGADVSNFAYSIPNLGGDPVNKEILNGALKDSAHGGQVQNSALNGANENGPADEVLCTGNASGTTIPFEVASWDNVNGTEELYFLLTTWHVATNDSVWLGLNNSSVTTTQQDVGLGTNSNFWSTAGYLEVCHLPNGSTLNVKCALSQGTEANSGATATTGQIDGAGGFASGSSQSIGLGALLTVTTFTAEAWFNPTTNAGCFPIVGNLTSQHGWRFMWGNLSNCTSSGIGLSIGTGGGYAEVWNPLTVPTSTWQYAAVTSDNTGVAGMLLYYNGANITHSTSGSGSISASASNASIGHVPLGGYANGAIDEVRVSSSVRSANFILNNYWLESPHLLGVSGYPSGSDHMTYQVVPASAPISATPLQFASCYGVAATSPITCAMPFPKQVGTMIVPAVAGINDSITGITDTLGFTYTQQAHSIFTGTLQAYTTDIYTMPTSATTGADTLTFACSGCTGNDVSANVWEVASATTTGLVTTNSNNSPPGAMSLTNPSNGSFLICNIQNSGFGPVVTTEGYTQVATLPANYPAQGTHASNNTSPYANNVASGTQTCTANTVGSGGTMIVLPYSAPASGSVRHRTIMY